MSPDKGKVPSAIHSTLVGKLQTDSEDGTDNMFVGLNTSSSHLNVKSTLNLRGLLSMITHAKHLVQNESDLGLWFSRPIIFLLYNMLQHCFKLLD